MIAIDSARIDTGVGVLSQAERRRVNRPLRYFKIGLDCDV
ncbi:hypothetical protein SynA1562_02381 [Synechococcus sp. A15-62]|nr:hypothetical protein SynA1562_02381 [Synechococcus sp. A15-62]